MKERKFSLAEYAFVEPLVNTWSAWAHLISPVSASLHLLNYQIKTMESYLEDPKSHIEAARNPSLIGGPFIDIDPARACEVKELLRSTEEIQAENIKLAEAVTKFHNWLVDEARGQSLEPYYTTLPSALAGYVELVYDYYNRPTIRFLENMLYRSNYYNERLQSFRFAKLRFDGCRQFFMSTPRLRDEAQIDWDVPFGDHRVDEFFKLDIEPRSLGYIREILELSSSHDQLLLPYLKEDPPIIPQKWDKQTIRIKYFGHACLLVEWNGVSIMVDPCIGVRPIDGGIDRFSYQDLPKEIDYALITHNHQDHYCLESLFRLRHRVKCLVTPRSYGMLYGDVSLKNMARVLGFKNIAELDTFESIGLQDGEIIAIPFLGEHGDLAHSKTAYVVRAGKEQILFGADSDCLDKRLYENVRKSLGPIGTVFLGLECVGAPLSWSCGPLFLKKPQRDHDQNRRYHGCDAKAAWDIIETIGAQRLYNYAMGMEPWVEYLLGIGLNEESTQIRESNKLLARVRGRGGLVAERLYGKDEILIDSNNSKDRLFISSQHEKLLDITAHRTVATERQEVCEFPLSLIQEELWSLNESKPENLSHFVSASVALTGPINRMAIVWSISEILDRYDVLRSSFPSVQGRPTLVITPSHPLALRWVDLRELPENVRREEAMRLAGDDGQQSSDLSQGPLLRFTILPLDKNEHWLIISAHRMICDSRSISLILHNLVELYNAFSEGKSATLPKPTIQYVDFANWQRKSLQDQTWETELAYWKQQLAGAPPLLKLTTDNHLLANSDFKRAQDLVRLTAELSESLREFSRRSNCALFVTLLASFQLLLHHYTKQNDIVLGIPADNRDSVEEKDLIGPFEDTLIIRTDLCELQSFIEFQERVGRVVQRAIEHRNVPFTLLSRFLQPEKRDCRKMPFQAMFALDLSLVENLAFKDLTLTPLTFQRKRMWCDLILSLADEKTGIVGSLEYDNYLFQESTPSAIVEYYKALLECIILYPEKSLHELFFVVEERVDYGDSFVSVLGASDEDDLFVF